MDRVKRQQLMLASLALVFLTSASVSCDRQAAGRRIADASGNEGFKSPCGSSEQVAHRVGRCLEPIFELVEGKFGEPKNDDDLIQNCNRFNATERCIRIISKDCLTGVHKTTVSAVASATRRFRVAECKTPASRARYVDPLKCAIKNGAEMAALYRSYTGIEQAVRDLQGAAPEEKLVKSCCVLNALDKEIESLFNRECPKSTPLVLGIVHAMTDDARNTLCINPKCQHALDRVSRGARYKPPQNFIEPVMQILFALSAD